MVGSRISNECSETALRLLDRANVDALHADKVFSGEVPVPMTGKLTPFSRRRCPAVDRPACAIIIAANQTTDKLVAAFGNRVLEFSGGEDDGARASPLSTNFSARATAQLFPLPLPP